MCSFKDILHTIIKDTLYDSIQIKKSLEISLTNRYEKKKFKCYLKTSVYELRVLSMVCCWEVVYD